MEMRARRGIKYPGLQVGDRVEYLKLKSSATKRIKARLEQLVFKIDYIIINLILITIAINRPINLKYCK